MTTLRFLSLDSGGFTEASLDLSGGVTSQAFQVITAGTGYSVGDTLLSTIVTTSDSPFTFTQKWVNLNTGLEVTSPPLANLRAAGSLGQTTSAKSQSVVLSSDHPTVVTKPVPRITASGTINSINSSVVLALADGINSITWQAQAGDTLTATLGVYASMDDGVTYPISILCRRMDVLITRANISVSWAGVIISYPLVCNIPPGATHIKVAPSAFTSGSTTVSLYGGSTVINDFVQTSATLLAGDYRVGFVGAAGIGYADSTSNLSAGQSFTSGAKSMYSSTSGTVWATATTYGDRFRPFAACDQPIELSVEASINASSWVPVEKVSSGSAIGGLYRAYLDLPVLAPYMRYTVKNTGASSSTSLLALSTLKA